MKKENISDAMNLLDEKFLAQAAEARAVEKKRRILPRAAAAAVAIMICGTAAVAAFAGGGLIDIKNIFGAVTGQEYVGDATDDFRVSVLGFGEGGIELKVEKTDPESTLMLDGCTFTPLSYSISDSQGRTVFTSSGSTAAMSASSDFDLEGYLNSSLGTGENGEPLFSIATESEAALPEENLTWQTGQITEPENRLHSNEELLSMIPENYVPTDVTCDTIKNCFSGNPESSMNYSLIIEHRRKYVDPKTDSEVFYIESEELLESGTYTLSLESFLITKKGDQDLEINGSWTAAFEIPESPADLSDKITVRFLGCENGEPKLDITVNDLAEAPIFENAASIRPISYEITGAGELLLEWIAEKGTDGSGGICLDDMHPLIAVGRLVDSHKMSKEEREEKETLYGIDFDSLEPTGESVGCSMVTCRASDGSIKDITVSRRVDYVDKVTGYEISFPVESETYEAKDLAPWVKPVNATGTALDPTVPPEDGLPEIVEDDGESVTPEDGYTTLEELTPLTVTVDGLIVEQNGGEPIEIFGRWVAEPED